MIGFKAIIDKATVDKDGEWKVVLLVPLSEKENMKKLTDMTAMVLDVVVAQEGEMKIK